MSLQKFKDEMARAIFGITVAEAHAQGICIDCKLQIDDLIPVTSIEQLQTDSKEYYISGLCPACFKKSTETEGEE